MKRTTIGVFSTREAAEQAINHLHQELHISTDDISYVYRNSEGEVTEIDAGEVGSDTTAEGAKKGAVTGGVIGAIAGLATVAGAIPVIGPIFAAGSIVTALGIGGAIGTTAAGALTGAAAGGLIGALMNLGVQEPQAKRYEDQVTAGNILVVVNAEEKANVAGVLAECGATDIEVYSVVV